MKPSTRVLLNIYDHDDNTIKVWATNVAVLDDICEKAFRRKPVFLKDRDIEVVKRSELPFVRLGINMLDNHDKLHYNESELYHLNKVKAKMFKLKQSKPKKMLRLLRIDTTWK